MKKFIASILFVLVSVSSVVAGGTAFVAGVFSIDSDEKPNWEDYSTFDYKVKVMNLPDSVEPNGYLASQYVVVGETRKKHYVAEKRDYDDGLIWIYVYFEDKYHPDRYYYIYEANEYELKRGANERVIEDGYTISPYKIGSFPYGNGTMTVYKIPDRSNGDKRVRVTTCKRGYKPTDPYSECTFVILNKKLNRG